MVSAAQTAYQGIGASVGVAAKMGKWEDDESNKLREAVQLLGDKHWTEVSKWLAGKNIHRLPTQCRHRWHKTMMPNLKKGHWDEHENELLRNAVKQQQTVNMFENTAGTTDWEGIARQVPGRTGKACRERWISRLDPRINKGAFTSEEEETLMKLHQQFNNKWASIAKQMPGRTADAVKSKYISVMRRQQKHGSRKRYLLADASQSPPKRRLSPVCGSTSGGSGSVHGSAGTIADAEGDIRVTTMVSHTLSSLGMSDISSPDHHHHHDQQQRVRPAHSLDMEQWVDEVPGSMSQLSPMGSSSSSLLSFGSSTPSPTADAFPVTAASKSAIGHHHTHIQTALATLDSIDHAARAAAHVPIGGFLDMLTAKHVEPLVLSDDMPVIKRSAVLPMRP
jgi:hypothetical protein